jgi:hypothetical protein
VLRFAAVENFNNDVIRGLRRRDPAFDIVRVQDSDVAGKDDPAVLAWCADQKRILLTHDVRTVTRFAYERVVAGLPMPGVIEASLSLPLSRVIDDLHVLASASLEGEWEGQVRFLPI